MATPQRIFLYHRKTTSYNASSKKTSSFYAECAGKLTSSSTLMRPPTPKTHTASSLSRTPPIDELKEFEDDMLKTIQSTKLNQVNNPFLNKLKDDIERIKTKPSYSPPLTKQRTFTNLNHQYTTIYWSKISQSPTKKTPPNTTRAIHSENKNIITKLAIDDRVDTTANKDS